MRVVCRLSSLIWPIGQPGRGWKGENMEKNKSCLQTFNKISDELLKDGKWELIDNTDMIYTIYKIPV